MEDKLKSAVIVLIVVAALCGAYVGVAAAQEIKYRQTVRLRLDRYINN